MAHESENTPDVSVIIPAYRAASDIGCVLHSLFQQRNSSFEVIVVNHGSPDTPALVETLKPYASHIRYLELARDRGPAVARNAGVRVSRGRYLAFLDADDRWYPEFLERQLSYLDANPSCGLVYADALASGESSLSGRRFVENVRSDGRVTLRSLVEQRCTVILSTVVVRREVVVTAGMFDEGLRRGQDFDLWLRLAYRGVSMSFQRVVLAERRVRADGYSGDAIQELERTLNVLDRFGRRYLLDAPMRTVLRIRTMQLVDRLEIEQAKARIL